MFGAIYGSGDWGAINLRLGASYARNDLDINRNVIFPGFGDATRVSYDGATLQAFGEVGYQLNWGRSVIEPFVGASVLRLHTDGFQENGGASALTGYGDDHELATTTLGIRGEMQVSEDLPVILKGLLGWRYAYGDVEPDALLAFAGGASAFLVSGVPVERNAARCGSRSRLAGHRRHQPWCGVFRTGRAGRSGACAERQLHLAVWNPLAAPHDVGMHMIEPSLTREAPAW